VTKSARGARCVPRGRPSIRSLSTLVPILFTKSSKHPLVTVRLCRSGSVSEKSVLLAHRPAVFHTPASLYNSPSAVGTSFVTPKHKRLRSQMARERLHIMSVQRSRRWHDIGTFGESWFSGCSEHDLMWIPRGHTVPGWERSTIQSRKLMATIVANPGSVPHCERPAKGDQIRCPV
jgi:hypothetical protein